MEAKYIPQLDWIITQARLVPRTEPPELAGKELDIFDVVAKYHKAKKQIHHKFPTVSENAAKYLAEIATTQCFWGEAGAAQFPKQPPLSTYEVSPELRSKVQTEDPHQQHIEPKDRSLSSTSPSSTASNTASLTFLISSTQFSEKQEGERRATHKRDSQSQSNDQETGVGNYQGFENTVAIIGDVRPPPPPPPSAIPPRIGNLERPPHNRFLLATGLPPNCLTFRNPQAKLKIAGRDESKRLLFQFNGLFHNDIRFEMTDDGELGVLWVEANQSWRAAKACKDELFGLEKGLMAYWSSEKDRTEGEMCSLLDFYKRNPALFRA